jgi:hypothetical protein
MTLDTKVFTRLGMNSQQINALLSLDDSITTSIAIDRKSLQRLGLKPFEIHAFYSWMNDNASPITVKAETFRKLGFNNQQIAAIMEWGGGGGVVPPPGPYVPSDADAISFLTTNNIVDEQTIQAIDELVIDWKAAGLWAKTHALWPYVGATGAICALNLKSPGTFDLGFNGTWVHSATGSKPGAGAYATTGIVPNAVLQPSNRAVMVYTRTTEIGGANIGVYGGGNYITISTRQTAGTLAYEMDGNFRGVVDDGAPGFFLLTRINDSDLKFYRNGILLDQYTDTVASEPFAAQLFINANNVFGGAEDTSLREQAFAAVTDGLNPVESLAANVAVQKFETTMQRAV